MYNTFYNINNLAIGHMCQTAEGGDQDSYSKPGSLRYRKLKY